MNPFTPRSIAKGKNKRTTSSRLLEFSDNEPPNDIKKPKTIASEPPRTDAPSKLPVVKDVHPTSDLATVPDIAELNNGEDRVIEKKHDQRWPLEGEPKCVLCGRFGEYINDATENDVCSLECKAIDCDMQTSTDLSSHAAAIPVSATGAPEEHSDAVAHAREIPKDRTFAQLVNYNPPPLLASMSPAQVQYLRQSLQITIKGSEPPTPISDFTQCNLPETMIENITTLGLSQPTPIQRQVIPAALCGRDIFLCSQTGTGKTASYLIPTLAHTAALSRFYSGTDGFGSPYALIMSPTRELCVQIEETAQSIVKGIPQTRSALLIGGIPLPNQLHRIQSGVQYVIATPGRLLEILRSEQLSCAYLQMIVIDEADVMFSMGFGNQLTDIIDLLPRSARQLILVSATPSLHPKLEFLSKRLLHDALFVAVGSPTASSLFSSNESGVKASTATTISTSIPSNIRQTFLWVENASKKKQLFSLLNDPKYYQPPLIVFVDSRTGAELLALAIAKKCGICAVSIHGDKTQDERTAALEGFRNGEFPVIVATSILARGIHVENVDLVINFDMPHSFDAYAHQVGRAGRSRVQGQNQNRSQNAWAITFINSDSAHLFVSLTSLLSKNPSVTPLPSQILRHPNVWKY